MVSEVKAIQTLLPTIRSALQKPDPKADSHLMLTRRPTVKLIDFSLVITDFQPFRREKQICLLCVFLWQRQQSTLPCL